MREQDIRHALAPYEHPRAASLLSPVTVGLMPRSGHGRTLSKPVCDVRLETHDDSR